MIEISNQIPDNKKVGFGSKYPRLFQADNLQDMIDFREEELKTLKRTPVLCQPHMDQPYMTFMMGKTAIIAVPEIQHYPAFDPETTSHLFGLVKSKSMSMELKDNQASILVNPCKRSQTYYPYRTCFNDPFWYTAFFNKENWTAWRDISWERPVLILAQFNGKSLLGKEVQDYYWLLHISDIRGRGTPRPLEKKFKELIINGVPIPAGLPI